MPQERAREREREGVRATHAPQVRVFHQVFFYFPSVTCA